MRYRGRRCRIGQDQAGIDRYQSLLADNDWIDIQLHDSVELHHQPVAAPDFQQGINYRLLVEVLSASHTFEQHRGFELGKHCACVTFFDWTDSERNILNNLDEDAAEPNHHQWTELRIANGADHDLLTFWTHLFNQPAVDPRRFDAGKRSHPLDCSAHRIDIREVKLHAARIAL